MMTTITCPVTGKQIIVDLGVELRQLLRKQDDGTYKESIELVRIYQV